MRKYSNIVLNIPHSSSTMIYDGWDLFKKDKLINLIQKWTDCATDEIFTPINKENITPVIGKYNRFTVDYERLVDDPLEQIGQGILYTTFEDVKRVISPELKHKLLSEYQRHINSLKEHINENTIVIDCHSFPSELSEHIDICIGFNNDWSKPDDEIIDGIVHIFSDKGYIVEINEPYSNSITPDTGFEYSSLMIEINKKLYIEDNVWNEEKIRELRRIINKTYGYLL